MRKIILSILAVAAFGTANAQEIKFGAKAGLNISNFTKDATTDSRTAFYFGGLADFTITEEFHIQPELLFSFEGADDDWGVSYVRIPVMAKYYVIEGWSIQAGPSIALKIGTQEDVVDDVIKSLDFGFGIGSAYELTNGLFFETRYTFGLANVSDINGVDAKTSLFQLGLGYRF